MNNAPKIAVIIIAAFLLFGIQKNFAIETTVFSGQVFDVEGKAVKGAEMFIYNSSDTRRPADFISARTDEKGHFNIMLPSGKYWVVARLRKGDKYGPLMVGDKHSGEPVEIVFEANGELEMTYTVADIRDAARLVKKTREDYFKIAGRVVDKQGAPVKMHYVIADKTTPPSEFPDFISSWTDEAGHYIIYLPGGKYVIGYADKFPSQSYNVYKELEVETDKSDFDIIVEENR